MPFSAHVSPVSGLTGFDVQEEKPSRFSLIPFTQTTITVDPDPRTINKIGTETNKIFGTLTSDGTGLPDKTVKLYYQYASSEYGPLL